MSTAREYHTAIILTNGYVLVTGGLSGSTELSSAEMYNPSTGLWTFTGFMNTSRYDHTASMLTNGNILVAGGTSDNSIILSSAEVFG
ncbi:unnamed protein product [Adineta steineri]|uniref:Uncharacterized protein n=1 Tax=Adineta steineri TaxID=433720 RepID=A0A815ZWQ9_9BILA|nr:unnamed protein product [Adineta steineri]CAF1677430.1 unnamed protein product [Adineta steineri]